MWLEWKTRGLEMVKPLDDVGGVVVVVEEEEPEEEKKVELTEVLVVDPVSIVTSSLLYSNALDRTLLSRTMELLSESLLLLALALLLLLLFLVLVLVLVLL